jgi:hypothetical protein
MLAESQIWDKDDEPDSLEMQRITCSFDSAHATHYNYTSRKGVPVPNSGDNYGIWSVLNGSGGPAYTHHTYGYSKYKLLIGDEFNNPDMYFYINYTDCDWTLYYDHADVWIRYNTDSIYCEISWDDDYFNNPTRIEQDEHPTLGIWNYKDKESGHSGQNTSYLELYLMVSTQNGHPYLTWNAYDERGGNNNVDYYEIWKKKDSGWSLKDTTSNTYYEDTSEDVTPPGDKTYAYYKVRAIEIDADSSLFGNVVKKAVYDPRQETKIDPMHGVNATRTLPDVFVLRQNFPNPFNPITTISFYLPKESYINLQIYDIHGKVVSTLINKTMDEGSHSVKFNSDGLPSGIYFYRLKTAEFSDIKRMLIIK